MIGCVVGMFTVGLLSEPKPDKFPRPFEVPTRAWVAGILVAFLATRLIQRLRAEASVRKGRR